MGRRRSPRIGPVMSNQDSSQHITELARKTAEVQILQRVSADINSTLDLDEICDVALRTMDELFEFHHANILLLEPDNRTLRVIASRGYENQAIGGRVQVGTGVIGLVAQKRRLMHVNNLGQQRAYAAAQRREMERSGRQAQLGDAIPVPGLPNAESQIAIPLLIRDDLRSEEHTSELQSLAYLVCRLLLEKKKNKNTGVRQ